MPTVARADFHMDVACRCIRMFRNDFVVQMRCNKSRGVKFPKICVSCQIGRVISINFEHSKKIATSNRMSRGIVGSSESFPPPPVVLVTVTIVCISSDFKPSILRRLARTVGSSS